MKRTLIITLAAILVTGAALYWARPGVKAANPAETPAATPRKNSGEMVVAAGRVEPASEEIKIGSEVDGKLAQVPVAEGDQVKRGQILAVLVNADYQARVALAEASIRERQADLERLTNGNRAQEKRESDAIVREAEAVLANTQAELDRRRSLLDRGAIARFEFDSAEREFRVARARLDAAKERSGLVHEGFRAEDRKRVEAEIQRAQAQLRETQAMLAKTYIRSPIDGVVLRKKLRAGESVSGKGDTPVVTLGDLSRLRVRADVDESDVARLMLGQAAHVTAAAYGDRKFTGKVVKIGQILGRKNIRTDEPTERVDTKILETLIELDSGQQIPAGLRVDTFIHTTR